MKRFIPVLVLLAVLAAPGASANDAAYEKALKLVQQAQFDKAVAIFKPMAENGHPPSQFSMGLMYHLGRNVEKDLAVAYDWYKKAVLQDYAPALNNMGMMYLKGEYVAENKVIARKLFETASADHTQARDNYAKCLEYGWGGEQDIGQAINFYQIAGEGGYVLGWHHLAQIYDQGRPPEVPRDEDKAVRWYIAAAEKNFARSIERLKQLGRLPDHLKDK
ncbi:MAG: sel1 repeat family protein [Alphaproteobacteria bacterium]|nr:sel1 repeat family protein [Alphaproteobacteria bacterium]